MKSFSFEKQNLKGGPLEGLLPGVVESTKLENGKRQLATSLQSPIEKSRLRHYLSVALNGEEEDGRRMVTSCVSQLKRVK